MTNIFVQNNAPICRESFYLPASSIFLPADFKNQSEYLQFVRRFHSYENMMIHLDKQKTLIPLAKRLVEALQGQKYIEHLGDMAIPRTRSQAYFVQDWMAYFTNWPYRGWKVGATSPKIRELYGHDCVIPGRIFSCRSWLGEKHSLKQADFPALQCSVEFAFRLKQDIRLDIPFRDWSQEEIQKIGDLHPAIGLTGSWLRAENIPPTRRSLLTIAENGGATGMVFGAPVESQSVIDLGNHPVDFRINGGQSAENFYGEMRCDSYEVILELARHLAQRSISLRKGDFISTGAIAMPHPVGDQDQVTADFGSLGKIEINFT